MAYRPVWTTAYTPKAPEPAIAFCASRKYERCVPVLGLEDAAIARYLATEAEPMGRCCDHLFHTMAHLRLLGILDRRLRG
jgi:cation transport regulator ChaC